MEQHLDKLLSEILSQEETVGVLIANRQGLCLSAKGKINPNMSGIGTAISEHVCKLEPESNAPTICLYSGNKRCIIQKDGEITGVIYKQSILPVIATATGATAAEATALSNMSFN